VIPDLAAILVNNFDRNGTAGLLAGTRLDHRETPLSEHCNNPRQLQLNFNSPHTTNHARWCQWGEGWLSKFHNSHRD